MLLNRGGVQVNLSRAGEGVEERSAAAPCRSPSYLSRMATTPIDAAVAAAAPDGALVLAVSGGLDSIVLLDAAARVIARDRLTVATFDHGTGEAAARAAALVMAEAAARGIPDVAGGGRPLPATEAAWRGARWRFLRDVAAGRGARIVTAHTADDQVETVVMRVLRGTGARGLAGLYADSPVVRPLLPFPREALAAQARDRGLRWVEDPSNADMRYLRNRVRRDLVPALERPHPELRAELLALARRAASWRREMDAVALACCPSRPSPRGGLVVAAPLLLGYHAASLAVLWPAIAARVGVALDARGTRRLTEFTTRSRPGAVMPLSGGWEVVRGAEAFELRRVPPAAPGPTPLPLTGALRWGRWCFITDGRARPGDPWSAELPAGPLAVRAWRETDRVPEHGGRVRVKRLLAEAGIAASERSGWPVVVAGEGEGEAIVWIPGVSRARAATARSGRPGVSFRCEPSDG